MLPKLLLKNIGSEYDLLHIQRIIGNLLATAKMGIGLVKSKDQKLRLCKVDLSWKLGQSMTGVVHF